MNFAITLHSQSGSNPVVTNQRISVSENNLKTSIMVW